MKVEMRCRRWRGTFGPDPDLKDSPPHIWHRRKSATKGGKLWIRGRFGPTAAPSSRRPKQPAYPREVAH